MPTPYTSRRDHPVRYTAVSRSAFTGTPDTAIAEPPTSERRSTTATEWPKYAAWLAPLSPAGPEPITTRSNSSITGGPYQGVILDYTGGRRPGRAPQVALDARSVEGSKAFLDARAGVVHGLERRHRAAAGAEGCHLSGVEPGLDRLGGAGPCHRHGPELGQAQGSALRPRRTACNSLRAPEPRSHPPRPRSRPPGSSAWQ